MGNPHFILNLIYGGNLQEESPFSKHHNNAHDYFMFSYR